MTTYKLSRKFSIVVVVLISFSFLGFVLFYFLSNIYHFKARSEIHPAFRCKDCNVILITMTTLRYDHMSSNGYFRNTTPNLDIFAKESIVFDNAFSHASWTAAVRASLYSGLYPFEHEQHGYTGLRIGGIFSEFPQEIPVFIDVLKKAGYTTAAFRGYNFLPSRFDVLGDCLPGGESLNHPSDRYRNKGSINFMEFSCTIPKALAWLKKNSSEKFFMHIQGHDLHCPYSQRGGKTFDPDYQGDTDFSNCLVMLEKSKPQIIDGKEHYKVRTEAEEREVLLDDRDVYHLVALYDESLTFADRAVGMFLDEIKNMGLYDNTIIVFTSEHGDMFGKYGLFTKLGSYYDDVIHVPLILHIPNIRAMRLGGLVGLIDVQQTILDLLGLERLEGYGKSIIHLILNGEEVNKEVFSGTMLPPKSSTSIFLPSASYVGVVRTKDWKLIEETIVDEKDSSSKNIELYDIVNDKEELHNLKDEKQDVLRDLQTSLNMWLQKIRK